MQANKVSHPYSYVLAIVLCEGEEGNNSCDWYFLNILIDTTIGVLICFICLSIIINLPKNIILIDW